MPNSDHKLDFDRQERLGFAEAIFCKEKNIDQMNSILDEISETNKSFLLTHLTAETLSQLKSSHQSLIDFDVESETGFFHYEKSKGISNLVSVVCAGTSDARIAREATRTLQFHGVEATKIFDVGVSGLWRLLERLDEIKRHPVVIAVAGMDAALPSVLGGLFPGALIAVPTSVGYGVAENGHAALHSTLVSCAPGITVCNINNGFGAAMAAIRIIRAAETINAQG